MFSNQLIHGTGQVPVQNILEHMVGKITFFVNKRNAVAGSQPVYRDDLAVGPQDQGLGDGGSGPGAFAGAVPRAAPGPLPAARALTGAAGAGPDLVVLDLNLPKLAGFVVLERMRRADDHVAILILSARQDETDVLRGLQLGADDYINKPFDHEEVLTRIKMLLKMKQLHDQLEAAYGNITNLISFGEGIIRSFNPLNFDYISRIDEIARRIIRKAGDMPGKPLFIIVGFSVGNNQWKAFRYEMASEQCARIALAQGYERNTIPEFSGQNLFFLKIFGRGIWFIFKYIDINLNFVVLCLLEFMNHESRIMN